MNHHRRDERSPGGRGGPQGQRPHPYPSNFFCAPFWHYPFPLDASDFFLAFFA